MDTTTIAAFKDRGLVELRIFSDALIANVAVDFFNRLQLQAYKLRCTKELKVAAYGDTVSVKELDDLVMTVNAKNKVSVDYAVSELRECPSVYALVTNEFLQAASALLDCPESLSKSTLMVCW